MATGRTILNLSHDPAFQLMLVKAVINAMTAGKQLFAPANLAGPLCTHLLETGQHGALVGYLDAFPQPHYTPKHSVRAPQEPGEVPPHTTTITLRTPDVATLDALKSKIAAETGRTASRAAILTAAFIWASRAEPFPVLSAGKTEG